jgi:osmoprotectant transport system permease protein
MTEGQPLIDVDWIVRNLDEIGQRTLDHVVLTVLAVGIGLLISFGLALLVRQWRALHGPVLAVTGTLYSIPSLALFSLLIPFTGIQSILTAEIALVSYTLLILVRNIVTGLDSVPPDVLEAAQGMGYTRWQRLLRIELPIALPVILAGVRIATVTTVGLVTVTALIGIQSLGSMIYNIGLQRFFLTATLVGSLGAVVLAVIADVGISAVQRLLTPWSHSRASGT